MDTNPFDQFGAELGGALPKQSSNAAPEPTPHDYGSGTFDLAPKQQQARKPVMNVMNNANPPAAPMNMGAQQQGPRPGNYGAYGTAPGGYQQWGQPPAQQPPQQQPPPPMGSYYNALVPSAHQSNPYALGGPPVHMPPSQMQPTQMHPPMMQPQMMHPQMHQNGAMGMSKSPPPNMMAPTPPNMMAPAPVAWGAPHSHHPPAPAHQPETGFDDMFGTSSVASGSGSVKAPGSLPPTSPPRSFQAPSQPAPAPPLGGGFDDIFGGGLAPVAPSPARFAPQGPPPSYGGPLQDSSSLDHVFGAPPPVPGISPPAAPVDDFGGLFDAPAGMAPAGVPQIANDPWGAPEPLGAQSTALVLSNVVDDDPFGIFGSGGPPPPPAQAQPENPATETASSQGHLEGAIVPSTANQGEYKNATVPRSEGGLPSGGEFYDAKIFTPTLGVMFFKPQELTDSLFLQTDRDLVNALDDRPVVAFIVEGSSARSAGVELGHVLLKVNGIDVKNPKEASRLIKEGPRPLPLLFYVPDTTVVVAEGEHMVKYDTRETGAPPSSKDWKPKYVVVGGIIAQSWMLNMYRSKSEYDIAVIETQARRPVSVKVKQFSMQGARIQNDWQGPQMVKYKNKLHPWKYIVVLPVSRNPIKISSPNLTQLKPVHEGIRRVLAAQQQNRGAGPNTAAPIPRQMPPSGSEQSYAQSAQSQQRSPPRDAFGPQGGYDRGPAGHYRSGAQGGEAGQRRTTHPDYQY